MKKILVILLLYVAIILFVILAPVGVLLMLCTCPQTYYTYTFNMCIGIDKMGNSVMAPLFNLILIKSTGHKFGCVDETISSVIGKNNASLTLRIFGRFLYKILDTIQKNHCETSIETDIIIPE